MEIKFCLHLVNDYNKNNNGLLRDYYPKKTGLSNIYLVKLVENLI